MHGTMPPPDQKNSQNAIQNEENRTEAKDGTLSFDTEYQTGFKVTRSFQ